ncbi:3-isopropylmalate dehydratase large subunit [Pseudonocardia kujensis]|uniref:aconitase/3-isopropylmalate dehydratase large subunit family protein n=1 Tax=Pseudonocardia kujensis TaxID=1128675 RepID=UPI001E589134|nr:aconitase/3-isopropylmalate dehydratase large subunit family protein [Pseudonocardia kujensis]MCE0763699.1 3-isopropylmalate dehydratase large subunit [Pseudonocardia kujensis]
MSTEQGVDGGMTVIETILARAAGRDRVRPGDTVVTRVDMNVLIDLMFTRWVDPLRIADPDRTAIVLDHAVPAPTLVDAEAGVRARHFAEAFGIKRFFDVGRHGICHQVIAENALALPGQVLTCTDSHTCAGGAYNTAARGLGPAEVVGILCTGETWYTVAPTIRYELDGELAPGIGGKDVFLHIAGTYGDATNHNLEFGGPGLASVPMNDRRTIATQGAEVSADFTVFEYDDRCGEFLAAHGAAEYTPAQPGPDANYAVVRHVDLGALVPHVARPGTVSRNAFPVTEVEDRAVQQCFVGSCANGQLDDLRISAELLRGRRVADGVRLIVTPASQQVYRDAVRLGYVQDIADAGAVVTNSTCGACFGYHMGLLGAGEVCLTASTRNFRGRMGSPDAEIYMASTATVVTSAVTGRITDPREVLA